MTNPHDNDDTEETASVIFSNGEEWEVTNNPKALVREFVEAIMASEERVIELHPKRGDGNYFYASTRHIRGVTTDRKVQLHT